MPAERGSYRAIPTVLLDGKDFHRLTERERWVFVALKLNFGPAGIEVHYRRALAEQLAEQTGAPDADAVAAALDTLERDGWIEREGNVVWIVRHLEFEPNMKPTDIKHRKSIQRHVAGLPRLAIVGRFIARYAAWFPADEFTPPEVPASPTEGPCEGPAKALERPSLLPKTDNREEDRTDTMPDGIEAPPRGVDTRKGNSPTPEQRKAARLAIRKHLHLDRKPTATQADGRPWTERNCMSIWVRLAKEHGADAVTGAVTVCRKVLQFDADEQLTMRIFNGRGRRQALNDCIAVWRRERLKKAANAVGTPIGQLLRVGNG